MEPQEAAKWGVIKRGLSDASTSDDLLWFQKRSHPPAIADKSCVLSVLLLCVLRPVLWHTVGTRIIADPEKWFRELISETLLILSRDRPCLELIIVSSKFQALFF